MGKIELTKICNIVTGKLDSNAAEENGEYPFFTCAPEPLRINSYEFDEDAIILAGNNAAGNFHCQRYIGKFNAYQRTYIITVKEGYDIEYIFYCLKLNLRKLTKIAQGSQTKFLTMKILDSFMIEDIPIAKQKKMSQVLTFLDLKIGNNRRINFELESMAMTIYDYWFLQFDFPDENGNPYKSSGGKMVWNEELKREIPKGWEVRKLKDIAEIKLGGTPNTDKAEYWNGNINWLNSGEIATSPVICSEKTISEKGMKESSTSFSKAGAVVMSITRYIRPAILAIDACYNQSVVSVEQKKGHHVSFVYPYILSQVDRYMSLRTGAQQPHINKEIVEESKVVCPPVNILKKYYKSVDKLYELQIKRAMENQELKSLRDYLLPILMNEQVGFNKF